MAGRTRARASSAELLERRRLLTAVSVAPVTFTEPDVKTSVAFVATLNAASTKPVVLSYSTADGTATAGTDYTAASSHVTIPAGQTSATFTIKVLPDKVYEGTENFSLKLSAVGATVAKTVKATMLDNDPIPAVSVADATLIEGSKAATNSTAVVVTLANASGKPVTLTYKTVVGSAGTKDFKAGTGTVTIPAGATTARIPVTVLDDKVAEGDEFFNVAITKAVGASIATPNPAGLFSRVVIRDNDQTLLVRPALSVAPATAVEGTGELFVVTLASATTKDVSVRYRTADGTATAGSDYVAVDNVLTIPAGQTSATITVSTIDDSTTVGSETFTLKFLTAANATVATNLGAIGTLTDHVILPPPTVSVTGGTAAEGTGSNATNTITFTVTLSAASDKAVTVDYATAGGTATAGTDFTAATGTLIFAAGQTTKTVVVAITPDSTYETNESFMLNLSNPSNATIATASAGGTITNDDVVPIVSIFDASVSEGAAGVLTPLTFTVGLSQASGVAATVNYQTSDFTAGAGTDYDGAGGTLTFAPGETSKTITVNVIGNDVLEDDKIFEITLSGASNLTRSPSLGVAFGTIVNDDMTPRVAINSPTTVEGNSGTTTLSFTATLSHALASDFTLFYTLSDGTASLGSDYLPTNMQVIFPTGMTTQTIPVTIIGDINVEPNETFLLTLHNPGIGQDAVGTGTILTDDGVM